MSEYHQSIVEKLALANINEQKAKRQWNVLFRLAWLLLVAFIVFKVFSETKTGSGAVTSVGSGHTAVVRIEGAIDSASSASSERVNAALKAAFEASGSKAVVLAINSPGGSPVQSGIIYNEIKRLRVQYPDKPVYAVIDDICASGGYYIAAAADKIYADQASLVGSIGVLMEGFGVTGLMDKLGVERRLMTAGENKALLDPFSPQSEKSRTHIKLMLDEIHQQFIKAVKAGRGKALKDSPEIFSGLVWTGSKAKELGLVDELLSLNQVAREVVKAEELVDYTQSENIADRIAKRIGASAGDVMGKIFAQNSNLQIR
jgi:protease IV